MDERLIELRPDQRIGFGNSDRERTWRIVAQREWSVLEIFGDTYLTCRLIRDGDGIQGPLASLRAHADRADPPAFLRNLLT